MRYFKGFMLAWNMLTIIPLFKVHDFFKGINGISAAFYPFVGFILGGMLYGAYVVLSGFFPPVHAAMMLFVLWIVLTGALHLDGFSDTVDGLFVPKERALFVMKDSHTGGMGMIFSVVFLIFKASSVVYLGSYVLLPFILALSRLNAVVAIYSFPYISSGITQFIKDELSLKMLFASLGFVFVIAFFMHGLWLFLLSLLFGFVLSLIFVKRYGGLNGDMYGFLIETTELFLLNLLLLNI